MVVAYTLRRKRVLYSFTYKVSTRKGRPVNAVTTTPAHCSFEDLGLRAGDRLQFVLPERGGGAHTYFTTLIGHIPGCSLLIHTPLTQGFPLRVSAGDTLEVQVFSGRHSCAFDTCVLRLCRTPVHYLHLAYPERVQRVLVRGALRVQVNLPGMVVAKSNGAQHGAIPITVADLSISGALVDTTHDLGHAGDAVDLVFKFFVQPNDYLVKFEAKATIRNFKPADSAKADCLRYGLRFGAMHPTEGVQLQSYLHQIILEERSRFA